MDKPFLQNTKLDFNTGTWWAYIESEDNVGNPKKFGISKWHYQHQTKIDYFNKEKCEKYLIKQVQEHMKKYPNFSDMPNEIILDRDDK